MVQKSPLIEQLKTNLLKLDALPEFAADLLWLTFYLVGPPENLQQVSQALEARGWINVGGWDGAFLYPKVQVEKSTEPIVQVAEATRKLCALHSIEILAIDADTSPDANSSRFVALYSS